MDKQFFTLKLIKPVQNVQQVQTSMKLKILYPLPTLGGNSFLEFLFPLFW